MEKVEKEMKVETVEDETDETIVKVGGMTFEIGMIADSIVAVLKETNQVLESWPIWPEDWDWEVSCMRKYLMEKYSKISTP